MKNYFEQFNNYFYNIFKNKEVTVTETQNFLNTYTDYLLHIYGLDIEDYRIKIHCAKPKKGYFSFLTSDGGKNSLKDKPIAVLIPDNKHAQSYDIFLNKESLKMKYTCDLPELLWALITCGHEIRHIIQYEILPAPAFKSVEEENRINELFKETIEIKNKKLQKAVQRYFTDFLTLSKMERDADKVGVNTLLDMLYILKANEEDNSETDSHYIYFLELCEDILRDLKRKRNAKYTQAFKDYYNVKNELAEFNIETCLP